MELAGLRSEGPLLAILGGLSKCEYTVRPRRSFRLISTGLSAGVGVLEAPGLHSSDEEVLRAEGLVVESVAVARAAPIQVPIDVESLAAPSTYDEAVIAPSHEHGLSLGGQIEVPSGQER